MEYLQGMELHFRPDLQARLDKLAVDSGRDQALLIEEAVSGYLDELAQTRSMLDRRYDELKGGQVTLIDGEEALSRLKAKTHAQRAKSRLA